MTCQIRFFASSVDLTPTKDPKGVPQCTAFPTGTKRRFSYAIEHDAFGAVTVESTGDRAVIIRDAKVYFDDVLPEACARVGSRRSPFVITWREYWPPTQDEQRDGVQVQALGAASKVNEKSSLEITIGFTDSRGGMLCYAHFD